MSKNILNKDKDILFYYFIILLFWIVFWTRIFGIQQWRMFGYNCYCLLAHFLNTVFDTTIVQPRFYNPYGYFKVKEKDEKDLEYYQTMLDAALYLRKIYLIRKDYQSLKRLEEDIKFYSKMVENKKNENTYGY